VPDPADAPGATEADAQSYDQFTLTLAPEAWNDAVVLFPLPLEANTLVVATTGVAAAVTAAGVAGATLLVAPTEVPPQLATAMSTSANTPHLDAFRGQLDAFKSSVISSVTVFLQFNRGHSRTPCFRSLAIEFALNPCLARAR
jgi:hypothetical protein